jgi:poly-gamma-glutamate synthesis protein (capsule biosynthesis protein)
MTAVGDILPGRHVVEKMNKYGVDYPFKAIAPAVKGSDVTYGDLECPLTDRITPPTSGMLFSAPKKTIQGVKLLGLNVVSVANNHTTNFGVEPFVDTLKLLQDNKIAYCGGGYDYDQAHTPAVLDAGGMKMSFLGYDSIPDVIKAGSGPGVAWLSLPPWNAASPEELDQVLSDIRAAKAKSNYVVACFHWSAEDVYYPSDAMKNVAYKAIDAGADMVLGSHPHTIQPIEYHNGHLIVYSMGNFVFDQMQRDQTREGFFIKCTFLNSELTKVTLVPYKIRDYSQPVLQTGAAGQKILNKVLKLSGH